MASRTVRYQPYHDSDLNSAPLLSFIRRHVTLLDPDFREPSTDEWRESQEQRDWHMITVRLSGREKGYRMTYDELLEPRASGIVASGVTVEAFGLPEGCEISVRCERSWHDPRYIELSVSGPEPAVQAIEAAFAREFGPDAKGM
jgi:hypothetical protein